MGKVRDEADSCYSATQAMFVACAPSRRLVYHVALSLAIAHEDEPKLKRCQQTRKPFSEPAHRARSTPQDTILPRKLGEGLESFH